MTELAVRVENVWKRFGYRRALAGVDLEVESGASVVIFGANGAGKSTLLKILATRSRPSSGRLSVFGHDLSGNVLQARREIGVVFHEACLRSDLTLDENLRFHAGLYGVRDMTRVNEMVELLGLQTRRGEPIRVFSQGMLKRAALIRSLIHDPRLWLLDEPFAGLDPDGQRLLEEVVVAERARGRTVVFITHDIERGLGLAEDAVLLRNGEVVARGKETVRGALA